MADEFVKQQDPGGVSVIGGTIVPFGPTEILGRKSDSFETEILKLFFQAVAIGGLAINATASPLTNIYIATHTADPGEAGTAVTNESAFTGYARVAVARSTAGWTVTGNQASNAAAVALPRCTGGTETITHVSIVDTASGSGRIFYSEALGQSVGMTGGIQLTFPVGALVVTEE